MKKLIFCFLTIIIIALGMAVFALAQEASPTILSEQAEITAQDLGVATPKMLPDSKLYFLKDWGRSLKSIFTFDAVKSAELRQKFTSERLIELKLLAQKTDNAGLIKKAAENSQKEIDNLKNQVDKIKNDAQSSPEVDKFLSKFTDQAVLQQQLLAKLETKVPAKAFPAIEAAREKHLQRFGQIMTKLEDKDKIAERLNSAIEKQAESGLRPMQDLQLLKGLEDKLPLPAKEALKKIEEAKFEKLRESLGKMEPAKQLETMESLQKIGGDEEKQLEIMESLRAEIGGGRETEKKLEEIRVKTIEKIEKMPQRSSCPPWAAPLPGFCQEGRLVVGKDDQGCLLPAKCVVPQETKKETMKPGVCTALWDPVCGSDDKTYSNQCFAKQAGISIIHFGACEELPEKPPVPAPVSP